MLYSLPVKTVRERYLKVYVAAVNDVLRMEYGLLYQSLPGEYRPLRDDLRMAGVAFTIKGMPSLKTDGEMERRARLLEALPEDSVAVWDCTGDRATAQWGEVMTMAAKRRGCRGAVVNGVRDVERILPQNFQVFYRYRSPSGMYGRFCIVDHQIPVLIGETLIHPGDFIVGDMDGVVVVPRKLVVEVLEKAEAVLGREVEVKGWVKEGLEPTEVVRRGGYF